MTERNRQRAKEFLKQFDIKTREIKTREEMLQAKGEFIGTIEYPDNIETTKYPDGIKKIIIK